MTRRLPILVCLLILGACASLSEKQCRTADWHDLGARDAYDGYDRSRFEDHRLACTEHEVVPDRSRYASGYDEGLARFCTASRGYVASLQGKAYRNTCPPDTEPEFQRGFRLGGEVLRETRRIGTLQGQVQSMEKKLQAADNQEERERLRRQIRDLDAEITSARRQLRRLQEEAAQTGLL